MNVTPGISLLSALLFIPAASSYGQQTEKQFPDSIRFRRMEVPKRANNLIKTNPVALIFGCIPFYTGEARLVNETTVSLYQSVYIGASYLYKSPFLSLVERDSASNPDGIRLKVNGWRVQAGYKFYLNGMIKSQRDQMRGPAPKGAYVAPHISYATAKVTTSYLKSQGKYYRINFFNVDLRTGYQLVAGRKFAFDIFTGFGYMDNKVVYHESNRANYRVDTSEDGYFYTSYLKIVFGFNLGFAY